MARRGIVWTAAMLRGLRDGYERGVPVRDIAAGLGVTKSMVLHKARALDLLHRTGRRRVASAGPVRVRYWAAPASKLPPVDDRNPVGPVARALFELDGRARETRGGFMLDRCPASVFQLIAAANAIRRAMGAMPIQVGGERKRS